MSEDMEDIKETDPQIEEEQDLEDIAEESGEGGDVETTLESVIEAILFASDEPMNVNRLLKITEVGETKQIRSCIDNLNEKYNQKVILYFLYLSFCMHIQSMVYF